MRSTIALVPALTLALSACGAPQLALPLDPVGKAATCGVVAAADARATGGQNVGAPLSFERQGQIIHYALLAGSEGDHFSRDTAAAVVKRMQDIQEDVTEGKWQTLVQPCKDAFPQTNPATPISLPSDSLQAEMGCYSLGKFMVRALAVQGNAYEDKMLKYGELGTKLDPKIARALDRRGIKSESARQAQRDEALATVAKVGSPSKVMDACTDRYVES
jgi:hypothetical protein